MLVVELPLRNWNTVGKDTQEPFRVSLITATLYTLKLTKDLTPDKPWVGRQKTIIVIVDF